MQENILDNDLIKKIQKIEEKYLNKYIREDLKDMIKDVINNKCKEFKENIFYKQVQEIDDESNNFGLKQNNNSKKRIKIYSDSAYVVNAFTEGWIYNWIMKGWQTADKKPVKNKELWEELYNFTKIHKIEFIKVKGHADNEYNNRCDELARAAIQNI